MVEPKSSSDSVTRTAALLRLLGDPTRMRILQLLYDGEQHVSGLCEQLCVAQPTVSHHLGLLRNAALLVARRSGKQIYYGLNSDHFTRSEGDLSVRFLGVEIRVPDLVANQQPVSMAG